MIGSVIKQEVLYEDIFFVYIYFEIILSTDPCVSGLILSLGGGNTVTSSSSPFIATTLTSKNWALTNTHQVQQDNVEWGRETDEVRRDGLWSLF